MSRRNLKRRVLPAMLGCWVGLFFGLYLLSSFEVFAQRDATPKRVTFYQDVLPIIQENCQSCHRPQGTNVGGMVAPMSFMSFSQVRPWSKAIAKQVQAHEMPPWHASEKFHGIFENERTLTDSEIATIVSWAETGAAKGRAPELLQDTPPTETEDGVWSIGVPDLVLAIEPFYVGDDVEDLNISFTTVLTDADLPEDVWVQAIEYKAGSEVVHHICNSAVPPGVGADDFETVERMGLGCIAPGSDLRFYPDSYGTLLPKGSTIRWGMHYHKEPGPGTGVWDTSQMAFIFSDVPVEHEVKFNIINSGSYWEVPPNHPNWVIGTARTFEKPATILSFLPHMHFRGKAAEYKAFYPDGRTELLLSVPEYDYNWQTIYRLKEPKDIPAGTRVEVKMWYDNTPEIAEPLGLISDRPVAFGLPTTDEMMNGWIGYANTIPNDFYSELAKQKEGQD